MQYQFVLIFLIILVVFKSVSLPIILVAVIEFAIFVNMGIPGFTGTKLPFIASIVIGTIQLGATVDYAILMTTKYRKNRYTGMDKKAGNHKGTCRFDKLSYRQCTLFLRRNLWCRTLFKH